ncbi:MAG: TetR/AcrR family transcriptional regulator [Dehalococcoidales bacterium]|jgi:AcrR family transcriptional regulator
MPRTKEASQQIRDESRQHILDRAAEVFASKGLANTKISDLAEAAGVSQGLLYKYFLDKDDIFIALLERAISGVNNYAQTAMNRTGTPLAKLHWLTEQVLRGMSEEPVYFRLVSQALALSGRAFETLEKLETVVKILRELIIKGQMVGEIAKRDPDQLVLLYLSSLYGLAAGRGFYSRALNEHFPDAEAVLLMLKP